MHWYLLLFFVLECQCITNITNVCANVKEPLGLVRKRRHLTFPKGSNMVLTISLVKAFMTHAPSGWNIALEIDVMYPLPDDKTTNSLFRNKIHYRQKKELWERISNALDLHNINGKSCILRSICEARTHMQPPGKSLVHDILKVIFEAPMDNEEFLEEMQDYNELIASESCAKNDCPFSLIDFILSLNRPQSQ